MELGMALKRTEIKSLIDTHGHMMIGVAATQPFTYTIGLHEKHGFELIIVGLRYEYAGEMLNEVAEFIKTHTLEMGRPYENFANMPNVFRECDPAKVAEYVVQAENYYGKPVKVVQFVMCDRQGRFPEDPAYDHTSACSPKSSALLPTTCADQTKE